MKALLGIILILGLAYAYTDRNLFFYGKSDFKVYHSFPINVKPEYWDYDRGNLGFVIADGFDFTIVKRGFNRYIDSEVFVTEIAKYGFDKKQIIVAVVDSLGHEHSIVLQSGDKPEIEAFVDAKVDFADITWVEVKGKGDYVKTLVLIRNFIRIGLFILIAFIGIKAVKILLQRVNRSTTATT